MPAAERAKTPLQDDMTLAHAKATLAAVAKDPKQPFFVAVGFHKVGSGSKRVRWRAGFARAQLGYSGSIPRWSAGGRGSRKV